jgi:tetratricopeptide (TPR) repeat protein
VIGDVTVPHGVTLTIEPGTRVEFATSDKQNLGEDPTKCELLVYGDLIADGTSSDTIVFTSCASSPAKDDWYGIKLHDETSNYSEINYCQIEYAYKGIYCYKCSIHVDTTTISNCTYGAYVDTVGSKLYLNGVACENCTKGVHVQQGALRLVNSNFNYNSIGLDCNAFRHFYKSVPPLFLVPYPDFKNCEFNYNSFAGIILDDSSPRINYCDISRNSSWGLKCFADSDPVLGRDTLTYNGESSKSWSFSGKSKSGPPQTPPGGGMYCGGTSCPIACDGPPMGSYVRGWNVIEHDTIGVFCETQSSPKLGQGFFNKGQNRIDNNSSYDIFNATGSLVYVEYNWWGPTGPSIDKIYGPVDWTPWLTSPPGGKFSGEGGRYVLQERSTRSSERESSGLITRGPDPDSTGTAEDYNELGTYYLLQLMYDEAIEAFQYILTNFSDCVEANYALVHLMHCYREGGYQANIFPYLQNLSSSSLNPELKNLALYMSVSQLCIEGRYGPALNRCQVLLAEGCDGEMERNLRFRQGRLYRYGLEDNEVAIAAFQDFIDRYPEDPFASIAQLELEILGVSHPPKVAPGEPIAKPTVPAPDVFALYQNYPNPFNAQTRIEYELPRAARVSLKVYNVLGQCVKTLANDYQPAGHCQIVWDGRDGKGLEVASGIYFVRMEAGSYALTRKMVLLR